MDSLISVLGVLATHLPALIAEFVLITLAVLRWSRHPRVSMLATTGAALLMLDCLLAALFVLVPLKMHEQGLSTTDMGKVLGVMGLARSVLFATGVGLIAGAIFAERGANKPA